MNRITRDLLSIFIACAITVPAGLASAKTAGKTTTSSKTTAKTSSTSSSKTKTSAKKTTSKTTAKASTKTSSKTSKTVATSSKAASTKTGKGKTSQKTVASNTDSKKTKSTSAKNGKKQRSIASASSRRRERNAAAQQVVHEAPRYSAGDLAGLGNTYDPLSLRSNAALVFDAQKLEILFEKNSNVALPIASITKLMTGLVVVEAMQDMNEVLEITEADVDTKKYTRSRLRVGTRMTRANLLHLALMSSENRAAAALGRNYPGGLPAFVRAMNLKAQMLGMTNTHYVDSSGLSSENVASARDLAKLVMAAAYYPILRKYSTDTSYSVDTGMRQMQYGNTNRLVHNQNWQIQLQKTGYISEAGQCLVMQAIIKDRPVVMVFLDSKGKGARIADAQRIRNWLTQSDFPNMGSRV